MGPAAKTLALASYVLPRFDVMKIIHHIPSTVITFGGIGILLYAMHAVSNQEALSFRALMRFCFPREHWFSHSTKVDVVFYLCSKIFLRVISFVCHLGLVFMVSLLAVQARTHFHVKPIWHETLKLDVFLLLAIFLLTDLAAYLSHWIQHQIPALWEFHKVHHAATFLTPLTTFRTHPIESLIDSGTYSLFLMFPVVLAELYANLPLIRIVELSGTVEMFFTLTFLRELQHTHFRISFGFFDRLILSPVMHQVHHSTKPEHWNKNYGARLSLWDTFFGTAFFLPKKEKLTFGLGTEEDERGDYSSLSVCYARPFVKFWEILKADFQEHMQANSEVHLDLEPALKLSGTIADSGTPKADHA